MLTWRSLGLQLGHPVGATEINPAVAKGRCRRRHHPRPRRHPCSLSSGPGRGDGCCFRSPTDGTSRAPAYEPMGLIRRIRRALRLASSLIA